MQRKTFSGLILIVLLTGILTSTINIQPVKASDTIYIRADGSIDPPTVPITTTDNVTYTFTGNINESIVVERNNIVIDGAGYTVQGTLAYESKGINLSGRSNVTIKNMTIKAFYYGISLSDFSNYNSISGNNITANGWDGILLEDSSNCNSISNNNITNNEYGIELYSSSNNSISGNTFSNDGLFVWDSYQNSVENNTVNGMPLFYLEGVSNHTVDYAGQVILVRCDNIKVEGLDLSRTDVGVELWETSNSTISRNNITNNDYGIYLAYSSNNSISGNNITNNDYGILLRYSSNNSISGNNITANNRTGIGLFGSSYNSISGNNVEKSFINVVLTASSNNNTISENNINKSYYGLWLEFSSNNNVILGNTIMNHHFCGIYFYEPSDNIIYHNNFINNTNQVSSWDSVNDWDDGYPSGGNYWSDYTGADLYSGPYQNVTGSDGIRDTPYVIDINNIDRYPLMKPYAGPHDVGVRSFETSKTVVGQGYNVNMTATIINYGEQTETFNLTIQANSTTLYTLTQTLTSRNTTAITFTWNTTDVAKGKYTITVNVTSVPSEADLADNTFVYGVVTVTIIGDVDGDRDVDIYDVVKITGIYHSKRGDPQFNPNSDLDDDDEIKIYDVVRCTSHYAQSWQP